MSKYLRYPNGYVGVVSDAVAAILATRPGHAIIEPRPDQIGTAEELAPPVNSPATIARVNAKMAEEVARAD